MPQSPLEQFEERIKKQEQLTAADVNKAFEEEEKSYNRTCDALGMKADDPARKSHLADLAAKKERMLGEKDLAAAYKEGRLADIFTSARRERAGVISEFERRHQDNYVRAKQFWRDKTAPSDAGIPDYEGYSATGSGLEDENANNKTRWALSGYLTALEMTDPVEASKMMGKAKEIYEKSDTGILNVDKIFVYENLQKDLALDKYMKELGRFDLASEPTGLVCGYLKISENSYLAGNDQYRMYLFGKLDDFKSKGRLNYTPVKDEKAYMTDYNKGDYQMHAMMEILTPKEWAEKNKDEKEKTPKLREAFDALKENAAKISTALRFEFSDARVKVLLSKKSEDIGTADEAEMAYVSKTIVEESGAKFAEIYKEKIKPGLDRLRPGIDEIKVKNAVSRKISDKEVEDVSKRVEELDAAVQTLDNISKPKDVATTATAAVIVANLAEEIVKLQKRLDEMTAVLGPGAGGGTETTGGGGAVPGGTSGTGGTGGETPGGTGGAGGGQDKRKDGKDRYLNEWGNATEVAGRFRVKNLMISPNVADGAVCRDDNGNIIGRIPAAKEVTLIDPAMKGRKIGEVVFVKVVYADKQVWVDQGQLELAEPAALGTPEQLEKQDFLGKKNLAEIPYRGNYWYQLGDSKPDLLAPGSQIRSSGNPEVDSIFLKNYVASRLSPDDQARLNALYQKGREASQFHFDHIPTMLELRTAYNAQFVKVWEYMARYGAAPGAGAEGAETDPSLQFLGKVHSEHREALLRMARDGEKPEGAMFDIWFNNKAVPCRLTKMGPGNYVINWNSGSWAYRSLQDAMRAVNDGHLIAGMTTSALLNPSYYKAYESWCGKLKEKRLGGTSVPGEIQFELDWLGTRRAKGNPVVTCMPCAYGGIAYRIFRDEAGLRGEKWRDGFAANFEEFMRQLGHIRRWAQEEDFEKGPLAYAKEYNFSILSDPRNYYANEALIGRPLYFGMTSYDRKAEGKRGDDSEAATASYGKEMVQLGLDWGGSGPADRKGNGWVNLWVNESGTLSYTVACAARGINTAEKRVLSMAEIFRDLAELRKMNRVA